MLRLKLVGRTIRRRSPNFTIGDLAALNGTRLSVQVGVAHLFPWSQCFDLMTLASGQISLTDSWARRKARSSALSCNTLNGPSDVLAQLIQ